MILYKVWAKVLRVEESESMGHFSRFINPRISLDEVNSFNNVSLIAHNNFYFLIELGEAHEADALHLVNRGGAKRWKQKGGIFENGRKFEGDFLPKSEKAVAKFSKAGGGTLPQTPNPPPPWSRRACLPSIFQFDYDLLSIK
jgi:hypothetical protein